MTDDAPEVTPAGAAFDELTSTAERIRGEVLEALLHSVRIGLDRHREVREEIGLNGDPPEDGDERVDRVLEYRRVVTTELLDPITLHFENRGPATEIAEETIAAMHATVDAVRALPISAEVEWGPSPMASEETDGRRRAVKKTIARVLRTGRQADAVRAVPVRAVAERHLHDVLFPAVDIAARDAAIAWAEWSQQLERAWNVWAESTLALLVRSRRVEGEEVATVWVGVREAAAALQTALEGLIADPPAGLRPEEAERVIGAARVRLEGDLRVAGSFVYSPSRPEGVEWALPSVNRVRAALGSLDQGVAGRLSLYSMILGVIAGASAVRARLLSRFEKECLQPVRGLAGLADRLEGFRSEVPASADPVELRGALQELRNRIEGELGPLLDVVPEQEVVQEIVDGGGRAMGEALGALIQQMPETLTLTPTDVSIHQRIRKVDTRDLPLRLLARQAFDVLRVERIATAPHELGAAVERLHTNIDELERVFSFAFDSALEELAPADDGEEAGESGDEGELAEDGADPLAHAPQLVSDALQNIADSLRGEVEEMELAFQSTGLRLSEELSSGTLGLIERVAAGGVQAQVLAARSGLVALRTWAAERWGPQLTRATKWARYWGLRGRRLWRRTSRAGRRALSGSPTEELASTRLVRVLAEAAAMMRTLPPVYQRLFTLDPVAEPSLLVGRDALLSDTVARWRRLEQGEADCIVFRAVPGAGLTSFLHALEGAVTREGGRVARVSPGARLRDEGAWAAMLAEALEIDGPENLEQLAVAVLAEEPGALPGLVTIDNLEHLFLRSPDGAALIEGTLTFMARTEERICWVGGITLSAWQQVEAAVPTAVAMIDAAKLPSLSPQEIRSAVILRHRRSGLPIRYQEPRGRRLLQRRLKRADSPEAVRSILADDYFDQLGRTSAGDLRLALFQWLQCCDFEQGEGLEIRPPARPDYSALDSLSWTEAFTLKAFLDHRTLTLAEHDEIFRMPREESAHIFESLVNRRLIRPLGSGPTDTSPASESRFRIHGLLVGAVSQHLKGRNVVH